ncbi:glycosyltransferase [Cellulomonas sp. P5_E12]
MTAKVPRQGAQAVFIVPAHDEAAVIRRCLTVLLADAEPGELSVIVVENGSTDATAAEARAAAREGDDVTVLETDTASKAAALRVGIGRAGDGAVVIVDADVELSTEVARLFVEAVAVDRPVLAAAMPKMDMSRASWAVRRYYRVWSALPYATGTAGGSGVFALSAAGVARIGTVPDVVNDDGWVRRQFTPGERVVVDGHVLVHPARTARSLVSRRARLVNGNREIDRQSGRDADGGSVTALYSGLRRGAYGLLDVATFVGLTMVARAVAWTRRLRGDSRWSTDASSRATEQA